MSDYQNNIIEKRLGKGPYSTILLLNFIKEQFCITCHNLLQSLSFYPHIAGIFLEELPYPQWVYSECWSCNYQNALWKLCVIDLEKLQQNEIMGVNPV